MRENISTPSSPSSRAPSQLHDSGAADWGAPIPEGYGQTRIVLLPRDPRWMFSYWEVTEAAVLEIKSRFGGDVFSQSQPLIRRFQVQTKNGSVENLRHVDVDVAIEARNWYLQVEEEGTRWVVELGLKRPNGEFILIARSNYVTLPRGSMSSLTDERWASLRTEMEELLIHSGGGKVGGAGSLEISKKLAKRWKLLIESSSWISSGGVSSSLISALRKT